MHDNKVITKTANLSEENYEKLFCRTWHDKISNKLHKLLVKKVGPVSATSKIGATSEEWIAWHKKCKTDAPKLTFLVNSFDAVIRWFSIKYRRLVTDTRWYWYNRFKQSHHIKITTLKKGQFYEASEMILHGVFQEIVNFVEKGKPSEMEEYTLMLNNQPNEYDQLTENQQQMIKVVYEAYHFWKNYDNRLKTIDEMYPTSDEKEDIMEHFTVENLEKNKDQFAKIREASEQLEKETEEHLINIMKIRRSLWN
jgi:hypothetical protein